MPILAQMAANNTKGGVAHLDAETKQNMDQADKYKWTYTTDVIVQKINNISISLTKSNNT